MRFLPYRDVSSVPNVIVDGAATQNTILTLSHWPKSGTPAELNGDTSTEIVFNYLDSPRFHVDADAVSNNHFDEDGLVGIFAMLDPLTATRHRALLMDAAQAGDFGIYADRQRRTNHVHALSLRESRDLSAARAASSSCRIPRWRAAVPRLLEFLPRLLTSLDEFRECGKTRTTSSPRARSCSSGESLPSRNGPGFDLALVRLPEHSDHHRVHRFTQQRLAECHPFALHNRTGCSRLLPSRPPSSNFSTAMKVGSRWRREDLCFERDLSLLANELNYEEKAPGRWLFDGVDQITRNFIWKGAPRHRFARHHRAPRRAPPAKRCPAWNPYGEP